VYQEEAMNVQQFRQYPSPVWWCSTLIALALLGAAPAAFAQDEEPNNSCQTANAFGVVMLPFSVAGELTASESTSDIDFYRFEAEPGASLEVTLAGAFNGQGTLGDPFLGFFDDGCIPISYSDDYLGLDSRLIITVPDSGGFVLAATGYPDRGFTGDHSYDGTYLLALDSYSAINSISGQVAEAETGEPLGAYVYLYACDDPADPETCNDWVAYTATHDGAFRFITDNFGSPLAVGSYLVRANYFNFEGRAGPFRVEEGVSYDAGTIEIAIPLNIGSISGRVVDAGTGAGLSGVDYPSAWVELRQCQGENGIARCYHITMTTPDGTGSFSFVPQYPGQMPAGDYMVLAHAQDYMTGEGTAVLAVEAGEQRYVGDIPLEPYPVQLSVSTPCENLPTTGGICRYSVRVANRSRTQRIGATWSLVSGSTGSLAGLTQFQTAHPIPLVLPPGTSREVRFQFYVPPTVPDGAWICPRTLFGENLIQPFFNTLADTGFCFEKGVAGFTTIHEKAIQEIRREQRRPMGGFQHLKQK
jgi:hypothetical protein